MNPTALHITECPVCKHAAWKTTYRINSWEIGECRNCLFARIDPIPVMTNRDEFYTKTQVVDRNVKKRRSWASQFLRDAKLFLNRTSGRSKGNIFYDKLKKYVPYGKNVLDIGCGDGGFLKTASERYKCYGVEISDYLADHARQKGGLQQIYTGDFMDLKFNGQKFDGITLISLIEHLPDPLGALKKCYDLLNDHGVFLLKTVNYSCLNRLIRGKKWTGFRPPDHIVYFNPDNLREILQQIGFKKISFLAWPFNDNMYCDAWK